MPRLTFVVTWTLLAATAPGQGIDSVDPYSASPAAFEWAGVSRARVEGLVGGRVLWLESEHFRLGSTLNAVSLGDRGERIRTVRDELRVLREANERIPAASRIRSLDPWLRVHLAAHRLEALYAGFLDRVGVSQSDFPGVGATMGNELGAGPHMGREEKLCVLMLATEAQLARVRAGVFEAPGVGPVRHYDPNRDGFAYCTSAESWGGVSASDEGMAADLAFHTVLSFVDGWGEVQVGRTPWWLREGLGHWFQMRVTDRFHFFSDYDRDRAARLQGDRWLERAVTMASHATLPPWEERAVWHDPDELTVRHNIVAWASVEHLVARGPEALRALLDHFDDHPFDAASIGPVEAAHRHREALRVACGVSLEEWAEAERSYVAGLGRRTR